MTQKALFTIAILSGFAALGESKAFAAITKEDEKKAAAVASNEADKWAASQKAPEPPKAEPPTPPAAAVSAAENKKPESPKQTAPEAKAELKTESKPEAKPDTKSQSAAAAPAKPAAPKMALNEMVGKINAIENDARVLRLSLDGGYSIEFTYDHSTVITNGGGAIKDSDLAYGDKVQVRYAGKDLKALEIERLEKAPRTISE